MEQTTTTTNFSNVTIYRTGFFGISKTVCKTLMVMTGVKYAQYDNAIRVTYLEKGKRNPKGFILDYDPWLRVVDTAKAIEPDNPMVPNGDGSSMSRYSSYDPRYVTDFEDKLQAAGVPVLLAIGAGKREAVAETI